MLLPWPSPAESMTADGFGSLSAMMPILAKSTSLSFHGSLEAAPAAWLRMGAAHLWFELKGGSRYIQSTLSEVMPRMTTRLSAVQIVWLFQLGPVATLKDGDGIGCVREVSLIIPPLNYAVVFRQETRDGSEIPGSRG